MQTDRQTHPQTIALSTRQFCQHGTINNGHEISELID